MQVKWDKTGEVTECRTAGTDGKVYNCICRHCKASNYSY